MQIEFIVVLKIKVLNCIKVVRVLEPRPGRVKEVVDINLDYPRDRTSDKFIEYRNKILNILNY